MLVQRESVQWLCGIHVPPLFEAAAAIDRQGRVSLVVPERMADTAALADAREGYPAKRLSTLVDRHEQASECHTKLAALLPRVDRAGGELSLMGRTGLADLSPAWQDIAPEVCHLRRCKEPDELAMLARANSANEAMYAEARRIVRPGLNELDLYAALYTVAVNVLKEPPTYFGQDFRSAARGGAPRDRKCEAGELAVLDLGVGYRGYHSDNCRTLAVGGDPTPDQLSAWGRVVEVFSMFESTAAPGIACGALFAEAKRMLAPAEPWLFNHHLGHGIGLFPHEAPRLNPNWGDLLEVGDVIAVEPGLYHESLRAGLRLEQNYRVTETGLELLTPWPLELC